MSQQSSFFGHPIGLRTLFLTEMWERMSYYGMRGIMVLFMTAGFTGSNPGLTFSAVEANAIYGAYIGLVYFMVVPVVGWQIIFLAIKRLFCWAQSLSLLVITRLQFLLNKPFFLVCSL